MAKIPKKDMNLYPLVVAPKKNTVKKGALFAVAGAAAVVLLVGGYVGARVYVHTQENLVAEMQEKANDAELMERSTTPMRWQRTSIRSAPPGTPTVRYG